MRYQRPMIIGREPIAGLLEDLSQSDKAAKSDVHVKENIVPVAWSTPYESPAIIEREPIAGLLVDTGNSDRPTDN